MKHLRFYIIIVILSLFFGHAQAQVGSAITQENLKIPMAERTIKKGVVKNGKTENNQESNLFIDTTTTYYKMLDSAQICIKEKDYSKAERYLLKAIDSDPFNQSNSLLLSNIATLQRRQGKLNEAVKNYTLALDMTPNAVTLLTNRAALYIEIDSINLARRDYERIINIDPSDEEARYNLGMLALEQNDYKTANDQFEEILRYNPNSMLSSKGMAFLNKGSGNYAKAAKYFSDVIKIEPSATLLANRADCYLMIKKLSDASDDINQAIQITPDDGYLYLLRAKLKKMRYENEEAKKDIQLAIEHGIDSKIANEVLKYSSH